MTDSRNPPSVILLALGTGAYEETLYRLEGESPRGDLRSPLASQCLWRHYKPDHILVCGTEEVCHTIPKDRSETNFDLLHRLAKDDSYSDEQIRFVPLAPGVSGEELVQNHAAVREALKAVAPAGKAANLHLDLTHGFRIQPMALLLSSRIYCTLSRIGNEGPRLASVHYGAYTRQESTPLVDVSELASSLDWLSALEAWMDTGVSIGLERLLPKVEKPKGRQPDSSENRLLKMKHTGLEIHKRSLALAMNNRRGIAEAEKNVLNQLDNSHTSFSSYLEGFEDLIREVWQGSNKGEIWKKDDWDGLFWLARQASLRMKEHRLLQGVTLAREILVRAWALRYQELTQEKIKQREHDSIFKHLVRSDNQLKNPPPYSKLLKQGDLIQKMDEYWIHHGFRDLGLKLVRFRNDLAHFNLQGSTSSDAMELHEEITLLVSQVETGVECIKQFQPEGIQTSPRKRIFWNLSSHPIETSWSEAQHAAARTWEGGEEHELRNLIFPEVDPWASTDEAKSLAGEIVKALQDQGAHLGDPVFVMGEPTLTFALVGALRQAGLKPLVATFTRDHSVSFGADGSLKETQGLRFCQFREFPST